MSRIGKKPIPVPSAVKVVVAGRQVTVEGPKGMLSMAHHEMVRVRVDAEAKAVVVERVDDGRLSRSLHGLTRSLIANMVHGVLEGYERPMELYGVGYSAVQQGSKLLLTCGYSHPISLEVPAGVKVDITTPQARGDSEPARFTVRGCDKQMVGEFAARCRKARKPEPYKGKGIRYAGERIVRKVGKAFAGASS